MVVDRCQPRPQWCSPTRAKPPPSATGRLARPICRRSCHHELTRYPAAPCRGPGGSARASAARALPPDAYTKPASLSPDRSELRCAPRPRANLEAEGVRWSRSGPLAALDGTVLVSGQTERTTSRNAVLFPCSRPYVRGGKPDPWVWDEPVRDLDVRGLGPGRGCRACSHSGAINVLRNGTAGHDPTKVHALCGGDCTFSGD